MKPKITFDATLKADADIVNTTLEIFDKAYKSAEKYLGKGTKGFTVEEIHFSQNKMEIEYMDGQPNSLRINLNPGAYNDKEQMFYQLGHEIVHTLAPMGHQNGKNGTVIEEGVAEYHARKFTGDNTGNYTWRSEGADYNEAKELIDKLLVDDDSNKIIALRNKEPFLGKLTKEQIQEVFPETNDDLAQKLADNFYDRKFK